MVVKIIATIGPSSFSPQVMKRIKNNGAEIARINTKYGNEKEWNQIVKKLRENNFQIMIDIKKIETIEWINKKRVDYVAVSYAKSDQQIRKIGKMLKNKKTKIIAKIETKKGLENARKIMLESDGLMIARGDLSKNISFEKVPYFKRKLLKKCRDEKKFVIVATEMMLSMVESKKPSNAEVDDVFEAVVDGASAIMLSEETAIGKHPALVVKTMRKIKKTAEKYIENN